MTLYLTGYDPIKSDLDRNPVVLVLEVDSGRLVLYLEGGV